MERARGEQARAMVTGSVLGESLDVLRRYHWPLHRVPSHRWHDSLTHVICPQSGRAKGRKIARQEKNKTTTIF